MFILDKMNEVICEPRTKLSEFAPRFYTLQIPTDKIRDLIGPGGKVIRGIIEQTGVKIDVEDSGKVNVSSSDQAAAAKAIQMISDMTATAEVGKTYLGKVTRLADFGAFVEIIPGTDGLLHISEVAEHRINDVRDELKEGDQVLVKVLAVEGNRIKLSRKAILKEQRAKMGGAKRLRTAKAKARPSPSKADTNRLTSPAANPTSIVMANAASRPHPDSGAKADIAEAGAATVEVEAAIVVAVAVVDRAAKRRLRRKPERRKHRIPRIPPQSNTCVTEMC